MNALKTSSTSSRGPIASLLPPSWQGDPASHLVEFSPGTVVRLEDPAKVTALALPGVMWGCSRANALYLEPLKSLSGPFLAAVSMLGLYAATVNPGDKANLSTYEQAVTVADHASAPFLMNAERGQLKAMFRRALTGTDGNLVTAADGTAYVRTGDIPAEWLRDSSAQVQPYLYFAQSDKAIAAKVKAVIERQALYIAVDPYANAFRDDFSVWERKFELDSLSYPILLAWTYWKVTGDASVFTPAVKAAFERVLETMLVEQDHDGSRPGNRPSTYHFESDTQASGKNPVAYTGMIWTAFRPSDDECLYNFLIPAQLQAVQAQTALAEMETFIPSYSGC